jgi:hypothetical protein
LFTCLWYSVFGSRPVQVVLIREPGRNYSFDLALVSTDPAADPTAVIERYAARWLPRETQSAAEPKSCIRSLPRSAVPVAAPTT